MMNALDNLLAPFARLLLARGVLFSDLSERLKAHYVSQAIKELGGSTTDSRVSVMTGLQRREVARLKGFAAKPPRANHLARLVGLWQAQDGYHDNGVPLDLPRSGDAPSFDALAWLVRRDVHPKTMLDSLALSGTIEVSEDGKTIRLIQRSYQPHSGSDEQIAYLAQNVGDHLSAATDNVLGQPRVFERAVYHGGLTKAQVEQLENTHAALQMDVLTKLNRMAEELKKTESGTYRFRAGAFFYQTQDPSE